MNKIIIKSNYFTDYNEYLELGETSTKAHSSSVTERKRGKAMTHAVTLKPSLWKEFVATWKILVKITYDVMLKNHLNLPSNFYCYMLSQKNVNNKVI